MIDEISNEFEQVSKAIHKCILEQRGTDPHIVVTAIAKQFILISCAIIDTVELVGTEKRQLESDFLLHLVNEMEKKISEYVYGSTDEVIH